jgi:hypothetical protein
VKTIIAGSRDIKDYDLVLEAIEESGFEITEVVCGKARGVDTLGERWANESGIPVAEFPADYGKHGKAAGPIRNREMSNYAEALIAIHDGISPGTKNMIEEAKKRGLKVYVKLVS